MAFAYSAEERAELDARGHALLSQNPDVGAFIRRGLRLNPDAQTLVYLRTPLDPAPVVTSARAFEGLLNAATLWLRRQGVKPGDVVSLLAPNTTATSILYWASMTAATVQPLNLLFSREAVAAQVRAVKAKLLFTPPPGAPGGLHEKVEGLQNEIPGLRIVVLPMDGRVACDDETLTPTEAHDEAYVAAPERIVALLPTGGTTSAPKIVPLSNRNVVAGALGSMLAMDARAQDRGLITMPLFHVGGAFCFSLAILGAGGTMVLPTAGGMRNPEAVANFWRMIESQRITLTGGVPTILAAAGGVSSDGCDISSLRQVVTGGSVCPPEIERRFLQQWPGDRVRKLYGMTEFAGGISQTQWDFDERPGSVGPPVAMVEVAVLSGGVLHSGPSPSGEILARGPQMFSGYFDADATGATFHDGWLRSGDLGHIGADGEVYVTGRAKDLIIRGGHNIDPASIEDVALRFPGVALAAAVGRPDAYAGETPILFVSPEPGAVIDEAALADFMADGVIEPPARPRAIVVIGEMPVTPVGKIFKPRLRELAAERAGREMLAATLPGVVCEVEARHDKRGLLLKVTAPAPAAGAARAELGKLPMAFEVVST